MGMQAPFLTPLFIIFSLAYCSFSRSSIEHFLADNPDRRPLPNRTARAFRTDGREVLAILTGCETGERAMAPDLPMWEGILRLLLAFTLAAAIGLERELREQEAGLRTHILVATGACLFVLVGNFAWEDLAFGNNAGVVLDPSRVVAYVITGIGFLGAGAILKDGLSVRGLTTAASLWVTAAIGATSAAGEYVWATAVAAIILISLWPLRRLAAALDLRKSRSTRLVIELSPDGRVANVARALEDRGVEVKSIAVSDETDLRRVDLVITGVTSPGAELVDAVSGVPHVKSVALVD